MSHATNIRTAPRPDYLRFTRRDLLIALAVIFLAFGYRVVIILDRAAAPGDVSAYEPLPDGADQSTYYRHIAQYREGTFPPPTFHFQPGMSYFLIAASSVLGTDNLTVLRLLIAALAAINCGFVMAMVRLAFGRRSVAVLAGLLIAFYPVSAFYDTDFVITSQGIILVTLMLFGVLWTYRRPGNWTGILVAGAAAGIGAVTRFELAMLLPVACLWFIWQRRRRLTLVQVSAAFLALGLVIAPVALHNRQGGANTLTTGEGPAEIYRGNNRDADGTYGGYRASETTHSDYFHFLWQDIRLEPVRFAELQAHKVGLLFSDAEPGNNLNYFISGYSISRALQANPLNFPILVALFVVGCYGMLRERQPTGLLFVLGALVLAAMTLLIWVEARIRTPIVVPMIPVAAFGLVFAGERLAGAQRALRTQAAPGAWKAALRGVSGLGLALALSLGFLGAARAVETSLPREITVHELPPDAQALHLVFNDTLELAGYQVQEQYSRAGIIQPFRPYVVTLYWSLRQPTSVNYSLSLKYWVDNAVVIEYDHPIGLVGYPLTPTSQWEPGILYVEHVGLSWRDFDGPTHISGDLLLSVYPERDASNVLTARGSSEPFVRLARPALIWGEGKYDTLTGERLAVPFGDVLILTDASSPEAAESGATVTVRLAWQTTAQPIRESYSIGIYIFDAAGEFVGGFDSPPRDGRLLTSSLPEDFKFEDARQVALPEAPGTYSLYVAVYSVATMERLPVPGSGDNLQLIGQIRVE